jgi:intracellular sulfur oxidation DsrE/DsrF family protein
VAEHQVVFHLDDSAKARTKLVLNNVKNLLVDAGGRDVEIEVVVNGDGVVSFIEAVGIHHDDVTRLAELGVRFLICGNSLKALGIDEDALMDEVEVVPAGVTVLVERQREGWAYIRP